MFRRFFAGLVLLLALASPAASTVNTSANKTIVSGNGAQTVFTFAFIGVAAADISVVYTDTLGNQTTLTQGSGATQYQISLNTPVQGAIWGVGGTITYNPSGTPIATGTTLTILRTLPLTQAITLQNQQSVQALGKGAETGLDTGVMQGQQISEQIGRALVGNVANSAAPNPLPPAAQAAGLGLCFDGTGNNVIACSLAPAGTISSAMAPVVSSSTLALGRTAFGLGTMALENINAGTCGGTTIQDDGSSNARVVLTTVADSGNQSVSCAFHGTQRIATGALVYTLPRANTLFNGYGFWIYPLTQAVTVTPNAADNFVVAGVALAGGTSTTLPAGTQAFITTNAAGSGAWYLTLTDPLNLRTNPGLNAPVNLQINATVAANALTIAVKNQGGTDPSPLAAVVAAFRDPTATGGDPIVRSVTAALSVVVPSGATLGTVSAQANRIWVAWADNAATPVLCVYNSLNSTGPSILPWDETTAISGTGITSGSTSAQTWYCSSATTTTSFRILGYVESKQATAGTWATAPSKIQLFGPGVKRPGDVVQESVVTTTTGGTSTSATFVALSTGQTITITPTNAANLIRVEAAGTLVVPSNQVETAIQLSRGNSAATNLIGAVGGGGGQAGSAVVVPWVSAAALIAYDIPNTASSQLYAVQGKTGSGTLTFGGAAPGGQTIMTAREIQI